MDPVLYAGLPFKTTYLFNQSRLNKKRVGNEKAKREDKKHKFSLNEEIFKLVCDEVAKFYEINVDQLIHYKTRKEKYHIPRKIAWVLLVDIHELLGSKYTFASIGHKFNNRTHSTILSTIKRTRDILETDRSLGFDYETIKKEIIKRLVQ